MKGEIRKNDDIPNLMGFISQTEKTGVLTLVNKGDQIEVGFIKGNVNAAVYKRAGVQELIKEYLVNSGKITEKDFEKIQELHKETKKAYEDILINEKYIDEDSWKQIIQFKIQEIVDELFKWNSGSYEFLEDIIMYENSKVKVSLNTQGLIMEGMRRIDEWPNIMSVLPTNKICFDINNATKIPENLGKEEKRLLEIINPSLTIKDLIRKSGLGKYMTYQSLYNLVKMGIIKKVKKQKPVKQEKKQKSMAVNFRSILSWIIVLLVIIATGFAGLLSYKYTDIFFVEKSPVMRTTLAYEKETIEYVLKMYYLIYNEYPKSLDALVEKQWVSSSLAEKFTYYLTKESYYLSPN